MRTEREVIWLYQSFITSSEYKKNEGKVFPAIHHVSVACELCVMAHKASIVWLQLKRAKTSVLQCESDEQSRSVILQAVNKLKAEGIIQIIETATATLHNIIRFWLRLTVVVPHPLYYEWLWGRSTVILNWTVIPSCLSVEQQDFFYMAIY